MYRDPLTVCVKYRASGKSLRSGILIERMRGTEIMLGTRAPACDKRKQKFAFSRQSLQMLEVLSPLLGSQ